MEAIAKYNFKAIADDEVSFLKGQVLNVLNMEHGPHWYRAKLDGKEGFIPSNYIEMKTHDWYYGGITRSDAEQLLSNKNEGAFLIRNSETYPGDYSLSVKFVEDVHHLKVLSNEENRFFLWEITFSSLNELIEYYRKARITPSQDVKLKDMISKEMLVQAIYDYSPRKPGELELRRGDIITVTNFSDRKW